MRQKSILGMVCMGLIIFSRTLQADTASSAVVEKIKAKYARYSQEIKDLNMVQEMQVMTPRGEMVSQCARLAWLSSQSQT